MENLWKFCVQRLGMVSFENAIIGDCRQQVVRMLALVSSLRLTDYLFDPSTVVTHIVAVVLLCSLRLQGVERLSIALVSLAEGLIAYCLWRACPSELSTVVVLWLFLNLYEYVLGPRLSLHQNAVLQSCDSYLEVVLKQSSGLQFDITKETDLGQIRVLSSLQFAAFSKSLWFKQIDIKESICLEDVVALAEGCTFEILKKFRSAGIQRERLISLTTEADNLVIVLVSETKSERDQWMQVLHQVLGTQILDVRSAWLSKLLSNLGFGSLDANKKIRFEDVLQILSKAGRPYDRTYAQELFKKLTKTNSVKWKFTLELSTMTREELYSFFSFASHRPEIAEIYNKMIDHEHGKITLNQPKFQEFISTEQKEDVSKETIQQWIQKSEPVLRGLNLSHIGFVSYLLDDEHSIFCQQHKTVYQDMSHPLSHYYIATSHNTYLTKDQLRSKSSVDAYISAFKRGCKCVELDIWDGTNNEPVIYHGYTLTSKILVKDVIEAIRDHGFCVSPHPVILSFENHCSTEQQRVVARYLREILGDLLYVKPIPDDETQLPSPRDLQGYVIVKGKKLKSGTEEVEEDLDDEFFFDEDLPEDFALIDLGMEDKMSLEDGGISERGSEDVLSLKSENDEDEFTTGEAIKERRLKSHSSLIDVMENLKKMKKNVAKNKDVEKHLAKELSDLVVYCQATGFKGLDCAREKNKHYEMVSLSEKRAFKLAREEPAALIGFTERQLCRIYPSGARIDSSNYNPVAMWNVGCQMVALNYQTPCLEMQLNQALFQDNGSCGYVLKPQMLREELASFDPRKLTDNFQTLKIRVISGFQIPYKNEKILKSDRNLSVQIKTYGFDSDVQCNRTKTVKNNGLNPVWNEELVFHLHVPDLAFIVFTVLTKEVYSGHFALPVRCMRQGYRRVPLLNKSSQPEPYSHLFVHISISS